MLTPRGLSPHAHTVFSFCSHRYMTVHGKVQEILAAAGQAAGGGAPGGMRAPGQ